MKNLNLVFLIAILFTVWSCKQPAERVDITGKWYAFTIDGDYTEYEIKPGEIAAFSLFEGNLGKHPCIISGDSIKYIDSDFTVLFENVSDSVILLKYDDLTDSLFALGASVPTFHGINVTDDSVFSDFFSEFQKRANKSAKRHGIRVEEHFPAHEDDEDDIFRIFEEVLYLK